jgi:hypothetical protein
LPPVLMLVSCLAYSSTQMTEVVCFCETLVDFQRSTLCYIPGDSSFSRLLPVVMRRLRIHTSMFVERRVSFITWALNSISCAFMDIWQRSELWDRFMLPAWNSQTH